MKLDIEGAEHHALAGASAWLGRGAGTPILEVHPWSLAQLGRSESDVLGLLEDAGWACEPIQDSGHTRHHRSTPRRVGA